MCLFLKGQNVDAELTESAKYWTFRAEKHKSISDPSGAVLICPTYATQAIHASGNTTGAVWGWSSRAQAIPLETIGAVDIRTTGRRRLACRTIAKVHHGIPIRRSRSLELLWV